VITSDFDQPTNAWQGDHGTSAELWAPETTRVHNIGKRYGRGAWTLDAARVVQRERRFHACTGRHTLRRALQRDTLRPPIVFFLELPKAMPTRSLSRTRRRISRPSRRPSLYKINVGMLSSMRRRSGSSPSTSPMKAPRFQDSYSAGCSGATITAQVAIPPTSLPAAPGRMAPPIARVI
jgi:hypothetical protein